MKQSLSVPSEAIEKYNSALDFSNRGEYRTAVDGYLQAIAIHPGFIEAYNNLGETFSKMGQRSQAVDTYLRALTISRNYRVLLNLGVEYYNEGRYQASLTAFKESIEFKEDFLEGQFYTALAYHRLKDLTSAEKHLKRVIDLDHRHLKGNYLLSSIYYEWKRYGEVISCLDRIRDIADDRAFIQKYYGFCHYYLGDYERAASYLSEALELSPRYNEFRAYLQTVTYESKLQEIGDVKAKIREVESRIAAGTAGLADYTHLSMLYIFEGENKRAEELLLPLKKKYHKAS